VSDDESDARGTSSGDELTHYRGRDPAPLALGRDGIASSRLHRSAHLSNRNCNERAVVVKDEMHAPRTRGRPLLPDAERDRL